jgi:hypothetical protein
MRKSCEITPGSAIPKSATGRVTTRQGVLPLFPGRFNALPQVALPPLQRFNAANPHTFSIYIFSNISFWRYKQKNCSETLPLIVNSSKETCCEKFGHPGCPKASALMGGQFPPHFSLFFHFNKIKFYFNFI